MDTNYRLISVAELKQIQKYLQRSIHYCTEARPNTFSEEDARCEPTEFYSGASGYARGTMTMVSEMLQDLPSSLQ